MAHRIGDAGILGIPCQRRETGGMETPGGEAREGVGLWLQVSVAPNKNPSLRKAQVGLASRETSTGAQPFLPGTDWNPVGWPGSFSHGLPCVFL